MKNNPYLDPSRRGDLLAGFYSTFVCERYMALSVELIVCVVPSGSTVIAKSCSRIILQAHPTKWFLEHLLL